MYDSVLVPTDGSDHAVRAAEHAALVADHFDATVHTVHVADSAASSGEARERAERILADVEAVVGDETAVESAVLEGDPTDAILSYAENHDCDLLAMGTHGRTGIDRYVAGSVTEAVLRRVDAPVLTARADDGSDFRADYEDVLVPTDGSDAASAAVDHAIALADAADATVHVLNVVDPESTRAAPRYMLPSEVLTELDTIGERVTGDAVERVRDAGLDAESVVRRGSTTDTLLSYVDDEDVDAVVMGTHGRTGVDRYLLGSTTERLVRHSPAPVLAVNAPEDAD